MDVELERDNSARVPVSGSSILSNGDAKNSAQPAPQSSATTDQGKTAPLPHDIQRPHDDPARWSMSWWPEPDSSTVDDYAKPQIEGEESGNQQATKKKRGSILERLGSGFDHLVHGHHGHPAASKGPNNDSNLVTGKATATAHESTTTAANDDLLYHIVLTSSHFQKDVNSIVQAVRICGTYTSRRTALAFAHRCLFDAGYEADWFTSFTTQKAAAYQAVAQEDEAIVRATGPDGEVFTVTVESDANLSKLQPNFAGRIDTPLYHVVQTVVHYVDDESGQLRQTNVKASFPSYDQARTHALTSVLSDETRFPKGYFEVWDAAQAGEQDCGYGENVVVHAVGQNGENFLISVLKSHEMEAVRVAEAAMNMR